MLQRTLCLVTNWTLLAVLLTAFENHCMVAAELDPKGVEFFEKKIRPVLVNHCQQCHSQSANQAGKLKGGLLLDSKSGMLAGGDSGPAIAPGQPKQSLLLQALRHDGLKMPPQGKLPNEVLADFETWIGMGAPDPRDDADASLVKSTIDLEAGRKYWAFQPIRKPTVPAVKNSHWARNDIDRFVFTKLQEKGMNPVSDASRSVLLRRLYFDLTGLPPTPAALDAFSQDKSPKALEKVVDRLLDSPQFGERWGRHWLDLARYAESNGNVDNNLFPHAWRYRDYVISSFNADKPYDQFLREQLAGDLLPAEKSEIRNEMLVATGFLALTSKPRPQNNPDFAMDLVADQIEAVTTGLLGLTVACARCHDHKFDPVPQTDYYALAGFFTSTEMLYGVMTRNGKQEKGISKPKFHVLAMPAANENKTNSSNKKDQPDAAEIEKLRERRKELRNDLAAVQEVEKKLRKKGNDLGNKNAKKVEKLLGGKKAADRIDELQKELRKLEKQLADIAPDGAPNSASSAESGQLAMGVRDLSSASDCRLCIRGESVKRGDNVPRGFVTVLTGDEKPSFSTKSSGRLELANWIASPRHPLTARVMANRVWHHLFGTGIVKTVDNFGATGEPPTHPELLDFLAARFIEQGWSVKKLIRDIVTSRTYGLASDHDPDQYTEDSDNRYLWRHTPRRLDAEAIRDSMLFAAGQLDLSPMSGTMISRYGTQEVRNDLGTTISRLETKHRSIYLPAVRNNTPLTLEAFDAADSSLIVGARDTTTVPSQALFLLNSDFVRRCAESLAQRLFEEQKLDDASRLSVAYQLTFGRAPTATERERANTFLQEVAGRESVVTREAAAQASADPPKKNNLQAKKKQAETSPTADARHSAWSMLCQVLLASAEFRFVE